LEHL
jgi:hypothetical protein